MADTDEFDDFHDAVSREAVHDDAAQQMKVARTCLDMGMTEEAIQALTKAAVAPRHRFEAAAMLGRVFRDRGDLAQAIDWFERAAGAPAPSAQEANALVADLAAARAAHAGQRSGD